jgi:adenylate cyclase
MARNLAVLIPLAALLVLVVWWLKPSQEDLLEEAGAAQAVTPSIVVLPFENLSNRDGQEQFADGITEDIITDLSGLSNLRVIASNTAFSFKGKRVAAQAIGAELGVGFVLEGSVRRAGDAIRLNAQLVETATGFQRWAKRYDRRLVDVFEVQDELTASIVNALALELTRKEKERLAQRTTDSLAAYDHFQEGQLRYHRGMGAPATNC